MDSFDIMLRKLKIAGLTLAGLLTAIMCVLYALAGGNPLLPLGALIGGIAIGSMLAKIATSVADYVVDRQLKKPRTPSTPE